MSKYLKLVNNSQNRTSVNPIKACGSGATDICGVDNDGCGTGSHDCCSISDGGDCGWFSFDCTDNDGFGG